MHSVTFRRDQLTLVFTKLWTRRCSFGVPKGMVWSWSLHVSTCNIFKHEDHDPQCSVLTFCDTLLTTPTSKLHLYVCFPGFCDRLQHVKTDAKLQYFTILLLCYTNVICWNSYAMLPVGIWRAE